MNYIVEKENMSGYFAHYMNRVEIWDFISKEWSVEDAEKKIRVLIKNNGGKHAHYRIRDFYNGKFIKQILV